MKILSLFFIFVSSCFGSVIYFNNGKSVEGKILEANSTHLLLQRAKDLQQFRIKVDMLTEDSQKQLELYHAENRYSNIPTVPIPLNDRTLKKYSEYIDALI